MQKKLFDLKRLLSSLLISTLVTQTTIASERTTPIEKGTPAPFTGFLVNEQRFNKVSEDLIQKDFLDQQLKDCTAPQLQSGPNYLNIILSFLVVGATGYIIGVNSRGN